MKENIAIIGAGIGGLTTALTLKQKGFQTTIYESTPEIKPVGAGIMMANNAMQVFQKLGIHQKIESAGNKITIIRITDERLNIISEVALDRFENKFGANNIAIHRGSLQRILAEEVGFENIHLSKRLSKVELHNSIDLTFDDESKVNCPTLIGADGINSTVRNQLFNPTEIRDTKQICWRGTCEVELPIDLQHTAIEAWGRGSRFGFLRIDDRKTYWYGVINESLAAQNTSNLFDLFKSYHSYIPQIIAATDDRDIFMSRLTDLKPISKWHIHNVCLIGDAAHATTPNLGQGACQAVEDAYALGQCIHSDASIEKDFEAFTQLRRKKAHFIVNRSRLMGRVSQLENGFAILLRNSFLKVVPKKVNLQQLEKIFNLDYLS